MKACCAALAALALSAAAPAQEVTRPWRLGVLLWHRSPNDLRALDGIRNALKVAGRPHQILVEEADSDQARAEKIVGDFRDRGVDLVLAMGTEAALICREHLHDLPVVYTAVTNPVESGVVSGWPGSGTNLAGNSNWIPPETVLGVFRRAVPRLARLGVLRSEQTGVVSAAELAEMRRYLGERPAGVPRVELAEEVAVGADDLEAAVDRLAVTGCQAIWIPIDFLVYENIERVARAAAGHGLPLVSSSLRGATSGAVAGVVVDYEMLGERAALIVLDVLERGRDPGTIPVGTMQGYQVVVNIGAARELGYEFPLPLLALADVVLDDPSEEGGR